MNTETDPGTEDKKKKKGTDADFFDFTIDKLNEKFFSRLAINVLCLFLLVRFIYYRNYRNTEFLFTFFIFNLVIFLITFLLNKVDMSLGAAFGLFAIFSMLRYRTEGITAKEMTYLFVVIAIGLICAVAKGTAVELLLINLMIITAIYLLESSIFFKRESTQLINYENIEMVNTQTREALIEDLKKRTGLNIHRIAILKLDYLRDTAQIKVYFYQ
ncbi:MAG: DUF4956 domain-containing protein [Bacteroidia bacterium]|nr:DUF4956 domain-containing protein [Bacteroidia bacterium]